MFCICYHSHDNGIIFKRSGSDDSNDIKRHSDDCTEYRAIWDSFILLLLWTPVRALLIQVGWGEWQDYKLEIITIYACRNNVAAVGMISQLNPFWCFNFEEKHSNANPPRSIRSKSRMFWNFRGRESFEESEGGRDDSVIESAPLQLILSNLRLAWGRGIWSMITAKTEHSGFHPSGGSKTSTLFVRMLAKTVEFHRWKAVSCSSSDAMP